LALHNYHGANQTFPPNLGLLLPYIEQEKLTTGEADGSRLAVVFADDTAFAVSCVSVEEVGDFAFLMQSLPDPDPASGELQEIIEIDPCPKGRDCRRAQENACVPGTLFGQVGVGILKHLATFSVEDTLDRATQLFQKVRERLAIAADLNGDGSISLDEVTKLNPLAIARAVGGRSGSPIGDDAMLLAVTEGLSRYLTETLRFGTAGETTMPMVSVEDLTRNTRVSTDALKLLHQARCARDR
jgi:hypothetical protein